MTINVSSPPPPNIIRSVSIVTAYLVSWRFQYHTFSEIHKSYQKARCVRGSPQSDRHADPQMLRILRNVPSYRLSPVPRESHPVEKKV